MEEVKRYEVRVYSDGSEVQVLNDLIHRENGPAYIEADGSVEWFLFGIEMTEEEYNIKIRELKDSSK